MTTIALLILLGIVLLAYGVMAQRRQERGASAAEAAVPALTGPPAPADLYRLGADIGSAIEASSHPRELLECAALQEAAAVLASPQTPLALVIQHAAGYNTSLCCAALVALRERPDRDGAVAAVQKAFGHYGAWAIYFALDFFASATARPPVAATVLGAQPGWAEHGLLPEFYCQHFIAREQLGDPAAFGDLLGNDPGMNTEAMERFLAQIDHPSARILQQDISNWRQRTLNRTFLQSFGRFWTRSADDELLVAHAALAGLLADAETSILSRPPRSLIVLAESRVGKTAFLQLLGAQLSARGWEVFEASGVELMAGQMYFGQLEERIRRVVEELNAAKRVAWYIPDFLQVVLSGASRTQSASIIDQLLPAISAGRLVVISESTPTALNRMLQARPMLRTALDIVRLPILSDTEIHELVTQFLARFGEKTGLDIEESLVPVALGLARQHFGSLHMPGAVLDLVKLAARQCIANGEARLDRGHLLGTLSQLTGLPMAILDESEIVDLDEMRRFFSTRVMGQDEAVNAIVDRIAMLKAGLVDPGRPIGVFLFAGPTGTGKTELAKTLANFLFGSEERMIRLDMSEFKTADMVPKIMGDPSAAGQNQSLIERIRKQPFSVILLDEFEKAHPNAWDLFLQVFDEGRLTDPLGQTADFRHAIMILTSNLGATTHQTAGLGFTPQADAYSSTQVLRAIGQNFRPEFLNRLDRVLVFQPLSRELMRRILRKELAAVLERRGFRNRDWAVEWEASALDFLLEQGFSSEMGARPLKRAIDQYLLAPLAATIVEHRFPEGDQFLFVRSDGKSVQVEFVDPDAESGEAATVPAPGTDTGPTLATMILQPEGTAAERDALERALKGVNERLDSSDWTGLQQSLADAMAAKDFWTRDDRPATLSRYALTDRVKAAAGTARSLRERLARGAGGAGRHSRQLISRLALQVYLCEQGIADALDNVPIEVVLAVQPGMEAGSDGQATRAWCQQLSEMFASWARRRHMSYASVSNANDGKTPFHVVSGFGAWRTLSAETGMHILESDDPAPKAGRAVARVRVAPVPLTLTRSRASDPAELARILDEVSPVTQVVRRYRWEPSPLVKDTRAGWRTGRIQAVLGGDFDIIGDTLGQ